MLNISYIFLGQGAQTVGMGKEFYEFSPEARAIFDQADQILKNGLTNVIFNGPVDKLTSTAYCQPAIVTFSVAALRALEAHPRFKNVSPRFVAGLSLGEYSALAACGALSFEDTLKLVERRSTFMEEATQMSPGKMAAVIGLDKEKILAICAKAGAEVANYNSPQQIVITGHADKVDKAVEQIKAAGAKSVIPLDVAGGFHSSLMQPAADKFAGILNVTMIKDPRVPVVSNVDAQPVTLPEMIRKNLSRQITSSVRWVDTIQYIAGQGVTDFIEIGPGKVLSGLLRRIDKNLKCFNIEKPEDIEKIEIH